MPLEVIEVEHDERDDAAVALRGGDLVAEALIEVGAVPDAGEPVDVRPRREQVVEALRAEGGANARAELGGLEWFDDVVDGAEVEALDLRLDRGGPGQKDDGDTGRHRIALQPMAHLEPAQQGQVARRGG